MKLFNDATAATGYQASLAYNVALCYYSSKLLGSRAVSLYGL